MKITHTSVTQVVEMQCEPCTLTHVKKEEGADRFVITFKGETGPVPTLVLRGLNTYALKTFAWEIIKNI